MTDYDGLAFYYDIEWDELKEDIPFLLDEAKKTEGHVLELACGSGRIMIPFAREGREIWGFDNSTEMLKLFDMNLEREDPKVKDLVHYSEQDMVNFKYDEKFGMIIVPFNSFLLMTDRTDLDKCLQNCREHLSDDGTFIVDVFSPNFELCAAKEPKMNFLKHFYHPMSNKVVVQWEYAKRDMGNQIIEIDFLYEEYDSAGNLARKTQNLKMSLMFRYELQYLLEKNGFKIMEFYGNYDRSPFTADSPQMIYICKKA
ncbi:MAG: class I SAM-dependent methyltransferase [bacterium]|nr:class I SAM-dependent methyltransferase [bacterium]